MAEVYAGFIRSNFAYSLLTKNKNKNKKRQQKREKKRSRFYSYV